MDKKKLSIQLVKSRRYHEVAEITGRAMRGELDFR